MTEATQSPTPATVVRLESLGPITVSAEPGEVAAFKAETGWTAGTPESLVPHTFPMRWLSLPPVKSVLAETIRSLGAVAFHESQNFAYEMPLVAGDSYVMQGTLDQQAEPARLILQMQVSKDGAAILTMETILRLVFAGAPA